MQLRTAFSSVLAIGLTAFLSTTAFSQSQMPSAPGQQRSNPALPAGPLAQANPFPAVNPHDFTAETPSKETVESFLKSSWGYDPNRIWQVQAILKTQVAGVSRVIVLVAEKGGAKEQTAQLSFFTLPDGNHIIADAVLPFGAHPFQEYRQTLQAESNGPSKGASSKELEFVEFADFECPHCKDAQPIVAKLLADYPSAHYVFENYPLVTVHSEAFKAAEYGVCVAKAGGNGAFFKFSDAVFDNQVGLTPQSSDQTLKDAVAKAGQDPAKIAACSDTAATKAAVNASVSLGDKVGVNSTPFIFVNGRGLPLTGVPYATLQKIINFQAREDGLNVPVPPAPPAPLVLNPGPSTK